MSCPDDPITTPAARRALLGVLLAALALLCSIVAQPFFVPITWAAILAYTSWPAFRLVRRICGRRQTLAAATMTLLVVLVLIAPLAWLAVLLEDEVADAYRQVLGYRSAGTGPLPHVARAIPWFGESLQQQLDRYAADPQQFQRMMVDGVQYFRTELIGIVGDVGRNFVKLLFTVVTVFFFYRDGHGLVKQAARVLEHFFGDRLNRYVRAAGDMTRAVIFGLLIAALVQGTMAGIGYGVFGVEAPVLLGTLTAVVSILPVVGTLLVWGPIGLALLVSGHPWAGLGLLAWGALLVHPVDNLIRPLLISNVARMPFLLVMFGVFGGLAAFGLVGLFVGPVALALATAVWRELLDESRDRPSSSA